MFWSLPHLPTGTTDGVEYPTSVDAGNLLSAPGITLKGGQNMTLRLCYTKKATSYCNIQKSTREPRKHKLGPASRSKSQLLLFMLLYEIARVTVRRSMKNHTLDTWLLKKMGSCFQLLVMHLKYRTGWKCTWIIYTHQILICQVNHFCNLKNLSSRYKVAAPRRMYAWDMLPTKPNRMFEM